MGKLHSHPEPVELDIASAIIGQPLEFARPGDPDSKDENVLDHARANFEERMRQYVLRRCKENAAGGN